MEDSTTGLTGDDLIFWERVFCEALPVAVAAQGWERDDKLVISGEDRIALAACWADYAVSERNQRLTQVSAGSQP